jgi:hypothetical protein
MPSEEMLFHPEQLVAVRALSSERVALAIVDPAGTGEFDPKRLALPALWAIAR